MVAPIGLPFDPLRQGLYSAHDLFGDVSLEDPDSYASCADIQVLSYFVKFGKNPTTEAAASTVEALHDNSISLATQRVLATHERVVAVMGGHKMIRGSTAYRNVALLAWELAREGFLLASGGGPGAMEATHLGALFASRDVSDVSAAIEELQTDAKLPESAEPRGC